MTCQATREYSIDSIPVPSKHRVDTFGKLNGICLVDTTGVDPAVAQRIILGLDCAEVELVVASLATPSTIYNVFVRNFIAVMSPGVREYGVARNLIFSELGQAEAGVIVEL